MAGEPWGAEETAQLESLCGDLPFWMIAKEMKRIAKCKGWPERSTLAIRTRAEKNRLYVSCPGNWLTINQAARALRTTHKRVTKYLREEEIKPIKAKGGHWIPRRTLRTLATRRPELFSALSEGELVCALDSETLAKEIAKIGMKRYRRVRPVVCVETGWRYESVSAAARAAYVNRKAICRAIKTGGTSSGRHWRYAD
jgi:hypothetical protein